MTANPPEVCSGLFALINSKAFWTSIVSAWHDCSIGEQSGLSSAASERRRGSVARVVMALATIGFKSCVVQRQGLCDQRTS